MSSHHEADPSYTTPLNPDRVDRRGRRTVGGLGGTCVLVAVAAVVLMAPWARTGSDGEGSNGPDANSGIAPDSTQTGEPARSPGASVDVTAKPARRAASQHLPERPTRVVLTSGTDVPVVAVGTLGNGTLDAPADIATAGWWDGGSRLSDPYGAVVVAAHVDSTDQGLGPFAELLNARVGDRVRVFSRGLRQAFTVTSARMIAKDPDDVRDLFVVHGPNHLVLITCSGPFDATRGGYQNLAVITATPDGAPVPRL